VTYSVTQLPTLSALGEHQFREGEKALVHIVDDIAAFKVDLLATGLAIRLAERGFTLFSLVGRDSEAAHDALDEALEGQGMYEVSTAFHRDEPPNEVAAFVHAMARGGGLSEVVVLRSAGTAYERRLVAALGDVRADWSTTTNTNGE
jgi:hypothetical protein